MGKLPDDENYVFFTWAVTIGVITAVATAKWFKDVTKKEPPRFGGRQ